MNEQERLELEAHAEELERAAHSLRITADKGRFSHERTHAAGGASAYEIEVVWLRGFLRRHVEQLAGNAEADDQAAREGRENPTSVQARWG